jgi:hypothetical protein
METLVVIDERVTYLDLEVGVQENIFRLGLVSSDIGLTAAKLQPAATPSLKALSSKGFVKKIEIYPII